MNFFELTLINLFGFSAVLYLLYRALVHVSEARHLRRNTEFAESRLNAEFGDVLGPDLDEPIPRKATLRRLLRFGPQTIPPTAHPSVRVIRTVIRRTGMASDPQAVDSWVGHATQQHIGELRQSMERLAGVAPSVGLLGTIAGFILGCMAYAESGSSTQLMASVSLALVTTFVAGIVVMIERSMLTTTIYPLELRCALHAQASAIRVRHLRRLSFEISKRGASRGQTVEDGTP